MFVTSSVSANPRKTKLRTTVIFYQYSLPTTITMQSSLPSTITLQEPFFKEQNAKRSRENSDNALTVVALV